MHTIAFYISGHGFGHASRDIEVMNALLALRPDLRLLVRTTAPRWLFDLTVRDGCPGSERRVIYEQVETDTGIAQIDSLHLDEEATVRHAREFLSTFDRRVANEARVLRDAGASLVVADIPPLGLAAAREAGVPAVALGNFTWDWIYGGYDGGREIADALRRIYARADLALRLPMHGGFEGVARIVDVPFIARRSARDPADTRRRLGLPRDETLVLVSFGGYGVAGIDLEALRRLHGFLVLVSGSTPLADLPEALGGGRRGSLWPFDEKAMYAAGLRYEDVVRAVDVVVTKPGFGIIAECLANDTALLYTSRGRFVEYDVLVAEMPRLLRARYIDHDDLFAGRWAPHLEALLAQPAPPERPPVDGAERIAELLSAMLDTGPGAAPVTPP